VLEPLGEQAKTGAIPEHDFDEVGLPTPDGPDKQKTCQFAGMFNGLRLDSQQ